MATHADKLFHLGIDKAVTRSNLSKANEQRDYRIFEEYVCFMIEQARKKRQAEIFKLGRLVYTFDTISVLRYSNGLNSVSMKAALRCILFSIIPVLVHINTASVDDTKAMSKIPYEQGSYYILTRETTILATFTVVVKYDLKLE